MSEALRVAATARLLALAFGPPDEDALAEAASLAEALAGAGEEGAAEVASLASEGGLAAEHERLFDRNAPCPPYEGSFEADPFRQLRQMADVAGFYRAFGAEPRGERPDHAVCELEFLAFLAAARADAPDAATAERYRETEDSFLRDHLGRWLPAFAEAVEAESSRRFYAAAARLARAFARGELRARGIVPAPLPRRRPTAVEGDAVECGAA
jgi:TorA maturation chaperone TorD